MRKVGGESRRAWRRMRPALALIAVLALAISACADNGDVPETADDVDVPEDDAEPAPEADTDAAEPSGELRWAIRDYFEAEARALIEAFEDEHPDVSIELELLPTDEGYVQRLLTARLGDDLPDMIAHGDVFTEQFADAEITTDLTPHLEASDVLSVDFFSPAFMDVYEVKTGAYAGEIHALPQGADAIVLYYNKDHFDEAGLDYPDDTWSYEDLVAAAEQLTTDDRWGFAETPSWHARYNPTLQALGAMPVSEDGTVADIGSPEALEGWRLMIEPMIDGPFFPQEELDQTPSTTAFTQQRVSMYPGVRAQMPQIVNEADFAWDVAPNPTVNGTRLSGAGSVAVAMTQAAEDPELVFSFFEWFYDEEGGMPILTASGGVVPPVPDLYDSDVWRNLPVSPDNEDPFVEAVQTGVGSPLLAAGSRGEWDENIQQAIESVTLAGVSIEEAFTAAQERAQQILDESQLE